MTALTALLTSGVAGLYFAVAVSAALAVVTAAPMALAAGLWAVARR